MIIAPNTPALWHSPSGSTHRGTVLGPFEHLEDAYEFRVDGERFVRAAKGEELEVLQEGIKP